MERLTANELYISDLDRAALGFDYEALRGSSIVLSGATGMIGLFITDAIMRLNRTKDLNCRILALGRDIKKAYNRFGDYFASPLFQFYECDINKEAPDITDADYIIHAASNTHPVAYAMDPIGTITANVMGLMNLLELAARCRSKRFVFLSSVEIYGENRGDTEYFREDYCGYIDCNTLRAGYPESKRTGEALCQAYIKQKGLDIVIPRLSRVYGPTMLEGDTKAISQFIKNGVKGENIVLKSAGTQFYSYSYVADAAAGILHVMLRGKCGEAYNISSAGSDITLRELAQTVAGIGGKKVVFELPDAAEAAGYSKATKAVMDSQKTEALGWHAEYDMAEGLGRTIRILKDIGTV